ncbi:DUF2490 domain-containing protein [Anditalea andensis]|uniref:DUF2490 domain-containing protein n=1 Tax=Anditalea andensis TaxID=1048983 RepID=A0A074KY43_9BACT|nr:DUF2490 domain-containing protein [Anditalea andensis]KEO74906.1 hypothetical protein EL17_04300 [Anditalea andensis]
MKKNLWFALSLWIFSLFSQHSMAQRTANELEDGGLYWTRYYLEWELSDKLQLDAELDNRRFFDPNRQFQTIVRSTLYYMKNDHFNFGAGLAYSQLYSIYTPVIQPEIRPHQEVNFTYSHNRWNFNHRIRTEQRFRGDTLRTFIPPEEVNEIIEDSYSFDFRVRYEFTTDFTLLDKNRKQGHWNMQVSTEVMAHLDWDEFFDTTRIYAGLQYYMTDRIRLELGYLRSTEKEYQYDILFNYDNLRFTFRHKL